MPRSVVTELDCRAGSLNVTWQRSSDARGYVATVTRVRTGHPTSCNTTETHCLAAGLECGADYNVTVLAYDHACSSAASPVQLVATGNAPIHPQTLRFVWRRGHQHGARGDHMRGPQGPHEGPAGLF